MVSAGRRWPKAKSGRSPEQGDEIMCTATEILCECCGEAPAMQEAIENGFELCEAHAYETSCACCGGFLDGEAEGIYIWQNAECEDCQRRQARIDFLDSATAEVEKAMQALGGTGDAYYECRRSGWHYAMESASRYADFYLPTGNVDEDGDPEEITIQVRVSDHYGRGTGDVNIVMGDCGIDEINGRVRVAATRLGAAAAVQGETT
jgi:hypothetical protein